MKKIGLAIFDLDGTILDSNGVWDGVDRDFLESIGQSWDEEFGQMVAQSDYHTAAVYTIDRYNLKTTPEALMKLWEDMAYDAYRNKVTLKPGVDEVIKWLYKENVPIVLATLAPEVLYQPALERLGLLDYFSHLTSANKDGFTKDSSKIYHLLCQKFGVKEQEAISFEDSLIAMRSMHKAGLISVGIKDERNHDEKNEFLALSPHFYDWHEVKARLHLIDQRPYFHNSYK